MSKDTKKIDFDAAVCEVRKACIQFADLYFHFSKVLVEEFGREKAEKLIEKVVRNRAVERGEGSGKSRMRKVCHLRWRPGQRLLIYLF
jgi:hypothetical protein